MLPTGVYNMSTQDLVNWVPSIYHTKFTPNDAHDLILLLGQHQASYPGSAAQQRNLIGRKIEQVKGLIPNANRVLADDPVPMDWEPSSSSLGSRNYRLLH